MNDDSWLGKSYEPKEPSHAVDYAGIELPNSLYQKLIYPVMRLPLTNRWVILTFEDGLVRYSNDHGIRRQFSGTVDLRTARIEAPDLWRLLAGILAGPAIQRRGPHANGPVPLAVFIRAPQFPRDLPWQSFLEKSWSDFGAGNPEQLQAVLLAERLPRRRPPFRLPLRILAGGPSGAAALSALESASWIESLPEVAQFGLQIRKVASSELLAALREEERDIVIAGTDSVRELSQACTAVRPAGRRPRLIIHGGGAEIEEIVRPGVLRGGISLLHLRGRAAATETARFVKDFIYGIVHDYPLHEALKGARRDAAGRQESIGEWAMLFADPLSNHDLRISDALMNLHDETIRLSQCAEPGQLEAFFLGPGAGLPETSRTNLGRAVHEMKPIEEAIQLTRSLKVDFGQELSGLVPIAGAEAKVHAARIAQEQVRVSVAQLTTDPKVFEFLRKQQQRRADVAIEALDEIGSYRPTERTTPLRGGGLYRLRVHLGHPLAYSLVVGNVPSIDPLLPETEPDQGHWLEVAVFAKDFRLRSPSLRKLYLPPLGGSEPVYFEIIPPERKGVAELRITIYHRNHQLQSFLLSARIGEREGDWNQAQIKVRLDFSRSARFTNLDELAPRALSIGVNQDGGAATHTFMFKDDTQARPVHLTETVLKQQVDNFRDMLITASYDKTTKQPRFATYPPPEAPASAAFQDFIRNLAQTGYSLHQALFVRASKELRKRLRDFSTSHDQTVQIVRYDPTYTFPWTALYDYDLPQDANAPVCLGFDQSAGGSAGQPCGHGPVCPVYCINGFWSLRQRIEQLASNGDDPQDAAEKVLVPKPNGGVRLAIGTPDQHTNKLAEELSAKLGTAVEEIKAGEDLLDLLWRTPGRPAVLIVVGHLDRPGKPPEARIQLPGGQWLRAGPITQRHFHGGDWEQPRTLVLLMACGSGTTDVSTLNDFVMALSAAGAAAVISTECLTFTRLVARFAEEVTEELWNARSLGEAIHDFNRRMVQAGNPLAFVFTCLGGADLTLVK